MSYSDAPPDYDYPPSYDTEKAKAALDGLTSEQKKALAEGMMHAVGNTRGEDAMKKAAHDAAVAAKNIQSMFISILAQLKTINDTEQYQVGFENLQTTFGNTLSSSETLAGKIADTAEDFDGVIINFCANIDYPVELRKLKIIGYIAEVKGLESQAKDFPEEFDAFTKAFSEQVDKFASWSKTREGEDDEKIEKLQDEIAEIDVSIAELRQFLLTLADALARVAILNGVLALLFTPAAPYIVLGGMAIAGLERATLAGIATAILAKEAEKTAKLGEIESLNDEINEIGSISLQLSGADTVRFARNILAITGILESVKNNALEIRTWLVNGAKYEDRPEYMKSHYYGVRVYKAMAVYFREYAGGIINE